MEQPQLNRHLVFIAQSVYPPHLDGLRTHGDNWEGQPVNVGLIVAIDKLQWSTPAWVAVLSGWRLPRPDDLRVRQPELL